MCGNGLALLGMQDFKRLHLLSIISQTVNNEQMWKQVNEQTKQNKSKINEDFKVNLHHTHKINMKIDYFTSRHGC